MVGKRIFNIITVPATRKCTGSIIMLHGSGGSGDDCKEGFKYCLGEDLTFPHLNIHYLTAPFRPYTLNGGYQQNVWFDRTSLTECSSEHLESVDEMANRLTYVINEQVKEGIPLNRIILGGFSMGGAMSLHLGLRFQPDVGGIFCLSSFLSKKSQVYEDFYLKKEASFPPLFMAHGKADDLIPLSWSKNTMKKLTELGVKTTFHSYPNLSHDTSKEELLALKDWVSNVVPIDEPK